MIHTKPPIFFDNFISSKANKLNKLIFSSYSKTDEKEYGSMKESLKETLACKKIKNKENIR